MRNFNDKCVCRSTSIPISGLPEPQTEPCVSGLCFFCCHGNIEHSFFLGIENHFFSPMVVRPKTNAIEPAVLTKVSPSRLFLTILMPYKRPIPSSLFVRSRLFQPRAHLLRQLFLPCWPAFTSAGGHKPGCLGSGNSTF